MFYRVISYLRFLLRATNQHGVHSPFVYKYITQCLYKKTTVKEPKCIIVLFKSIPYFNVHNTSVSDKNTRLVQKIAEQFPNLMFEQAPFDLIYLEKPSQSFLDNKNIHNDTIVILNNIHQTKTNTAIWKNIILSTQLSVTIDLYNCGIVFFRKEQAKEHFKIRI